LTSARLATTNGKAGYTSGASGFSIGANIAWRWVMSALRLRQLPNVRGTHVSYHDRDYVFIQKLVPQDAAANF
jgi:hypothetical protein